MNSQIQDLSVLVRHLLSFTGWRAVLQIVLMIVAALSEGLGLLLLVPLIAVLSV